VKKNSRVVNHWVVGNGSGVDDWGSMDKWNGRSEDWSSVVDHWNGRSEDWSSVVDHWNGSSVDWSSVDDWDHQLGSWSSVGEGGSVGSWYNNGSNNRSGLSVDNWLVDNSLKVLSWGSSVGVGGSVCIWNNALVESWSGNDWSSMDYWSSVDDGWSSMNMRSHSVGVDNMLTVE
jgi:hypothetical protein